MATASREQYIESLKVAPGTPIALACYSCGLIQYLGRHKRGLTNRVAEAKQLERGHFVISHHHTTTLSGIDEIKRAQGKDSPNQMALAKLLTPDTLRG